MLGWRIVAKKQLDIGAWNACVRNSTNEHIYGYSWYLDAVAPKWVAMGFGKYEQVIPVPVKQKLGISYIFQPEFYQRTSIFSSELAKNVQELRQLISSEFIKIDLTSTNEMFDASHSLNNIVLKYNKAPFKWSTNTERNIKKALKKGLVYSRGGKQDVESVIEMFVENTRFKLSSEFSTNLLQLTGILKANDCLEVRKIELDQSNFAYALFAKSVKRITLLLLASTDEGKKNGASHLLISNAIKEFSNQVEIFDFEGSQNPGISRFYLGFGGEVEHYYHYSQKMQKAVIRRIIGSGK
ncbi:MAG: hypothetical protein CL840_11205 [Crocinitomicaceae bacterium]|nr:hypothetical protein [Crocinitomicaceae bacterium]